MYAGQHDDEIHIILQWAKLTHRSPYEQSWAFTWTSPVNGHIPLQRSAHCPPSHPSAAFPAVTAHHIQTHQNSGSHWQKKDK